MDEYPITAHRPWPVSPVQHPLTPRAYGETYAPDDRPEGFNVFHADKFSVFPKLHIGWYGNTGITWFGLGLTWWPKVQEL